MNVHDSHAARGALAVNVSNGPLTRTDWSEQLLRGEILTGSLRPGERLKIGELQDRYPGLSPTPLREALSRLAGSGLVDVLPNRGVRVAMGSIEDLRDVQENRALLETIALERSLAAADEEWRDEVEQAFLDLRKVAQEMMEISDLTSAELIRWENAHRRFHFALIGRCGSPWLLRLVGILYEQSVRYRYMTIRAEPEFRQITDEHEALRSAALSGDPLACVGVLREHLNLTLDHAGHLDAFVLIGSTER
jgi:DNA-binding GntR family transcriptional regulator